MTITRRTKLSLRTVALLYLTLLLLLPLGVVFGRTFEHGFSVAWGWMFKPVALVLPTATGAMPRATVTVTNASSFRRFPPI